MFYGHEHNNSYKRTSYNGSKDTVLQLCGCLCNKGIWDNSSYIVGVLNIDNLEYKHQREIFSVYALNLLLNLYYIPVINATGKNTNKFLSNTEYFDFTKKSTYRLQQLMLIEQITDNDEFVKKALKMQDEFEDIVSYVLLRWIVRHGIITRNDKRENIEKLESKFFSKSQKSFLIERTKNKSLKE